MRRLIAVLIAAFMAVPMLAATPLPSSVAKPNVIVFPFTSTGSSINREASSTLATLIATSMANTGLVTVTPPPPGTDRKDYLSVARANRADYYVSGFMSPLGQGVSIVEQVVSTTTGIVVFSQSTQINSYNEAAGQGDDLAAFVSRHSNRAYAAIGTPPPAASPTPASSDGPKANLGNLFNRKKKTAAAPKPTPTPAARPIAPGTAAPAAALANVPKPAATATPRPAAVAAAAAETYAVLPVGGTADAALRELAETRVAERAHAERATSAAQACISHPHDVVLAGILTVTLDGTTGAPSARFELTASDCNGKVLWRQTHGGDATGAQGLQSATERAADGAIGAYLNPPKKHRVR